MEVETILVFIAFPFPQRWHRASPPVRLSDYIWLSLIVLHLGLPGNIVFLINYTSSFYELPASMVCLLSLWFNLWLQWNLRNFFVIRYKKHDIVYYYNYEIIAVSQITQWEIPITQSFKSNRFFHREWQISILFKNMSFLSTLKYSLIPHQIKNKCLRLTFTSFHNKGPISFYSFIICCFLYVAFVTYKWNCSLKSPNFHTYLPLECPFFPSILGKILCIFCN